MPNTYYFPKAEEQKIHRAAAAADIHEVCFLVFGHGGRVLRVVHVPNRARDTVMRHAFGERDIDCARCGPRVKALRLLGRLHSHILSRADPGRGDLEGYREGRLIFIYSEVYQELRAFRRVARASGWLEKRVVIV